MAIGTPNVFMPGAAADTASGSPCATTTTTDAPAGSLIVVVLQDNGNHVCSSLVDSAGNTYTQVPATSIVNAIHSIELWYCINTAFDLPSGSTFTATTPTGDTYYIQGAASISGANGGLDTANSLAGDNTRGSTTNFSLSTGTLAVANEIIIGADYPNIDVGWGTYTADSPNFTSLLLPPGGTGFLSDWVWKIVSSTAGATWSPSWTNNIKNGAVLASFEASATPPPAATTGGFAWSEC